MSVFIILFLVPILIQHFTFSKEDVSVQKKNTPALAFFFIALTLLVMLRHESVGNDTRNYINSFVRYSDWDWTQLGNVDAERGFAYFNKAISSVTQEPQIFLAITALITVAMIYPTYHRLCEDASLTIVLFGIMSTFVMMFSGIRQMLAIGIGFLAYECTRRKQIIPYILCVLLAISFHTSALMLLFMYPIYHARITRKWLFAVVPAIAIVFIFNREIFSALGLVLERYTKYDASIVETGAYTMLILFAIFTVFSFVIPDETLLDSETIGLRNFLLLALVLQMFAPLHFLAMRMNYYYIIFIPLLIPRIIAYRSEWWEQVAVFGRYVMIAFFLVYFFVTASDGGGLHVFPYHFFWESV